MTDQFLINQQEKTRLTGRINFYYDKLTTNALSLENLEFIASAKIKIETLTKDLKQAQDDLKKKTGDVKKLLDFINKKKIEINEVNMLVDRYISNYERAYALISQFTS